MARSRAFYRPVGKSIDQPHPRSVYVMMDDTRFQIHNDRGMKVVLYKSSQAGSFFEILIDNAWKHVPRQEVMDGLGMDSMAVSYRASQINQRITPLGVARIDSTRGEDNQKCYRLKIYVEKANEDIGFDREYAFVGTTQFVTLDTSMGKLLKDLYRNADTFVPAESLIKGGPWNGFEELHKDYTELEKIIAHSRSFDLLERQNSRRDGMSYALYRTFIGLSYQLNHNT